MMVIGLRKSSNGYGLGLDRSSSSLERSDDGSADDQFLHRLRKKVDQSELS